MSVSLVQLSALLEHSPVPTWVTVDAKIVFINQAGCELLGALPQEILGLGPFDIIEPEFHEAIKQRMGAVLNGTAPRTPPLDERLRRRDGISVEVEVTAWPVDIQEGRAIQVILKDLTAWRLAEAKLIREHGRLQALMDALPVGVSFSDDVTCHSIHGNPTLWKQFDVREHDNISASSLDPTDPGRQVRFFRDGRQITADELPLQRAVNENRPIAPVELEVVLPNGRHWWTEISAAPLRDASGNVNGGVAVTVDTTENKMAEAALRESEARLNAIYSGTFEYIGLISPDGIVLDCNRAALEFAQNTRRDFVGLPLWDTPWFIFTAGAPEQLRESIARAATGEFIRYEAPLRRPSGEVITFDFSLHPIRDANGQVVFLVPEGRDITDLKRTEAALIQSQKLAAVGRLAASIAHEINNPLESVTNLLYLINQSKDLPDSLRGFTETAQQELARVGEIATQTLRFYRQSTVRTSVRCSHLLDSVLVLYQGRFLAAGINVVRDYQDDETLLCFEGELRQVFTNIIGNALDASRSGGQVILRTRESTDWRSNRKGLRITVTDNGHGMSRETLTHIFEPFFSTKGLTGTGLGLWITLEIVQKHGGKMMVRSNTSTAKHGTVFSVFIPHDSPTV